MNNNLSVEQSNGLFHNSIISHLLFPLETENKYGGIQSNQSPSGLILPSHHTYVLSLRIVICRLLFTAHVTTKYMNQPLITYDNCVVLPDAGTKLV